LGRWRLRVNHLLWRRSLLGSDIIRRIRVCLHVLVCLPAIHGVARRLRRTGEDGSAGHCSQ
jgi:hypothetical protein